MLTSDLSSKTKKPGDVDESTDAFDAIDWLVKNVAGNNGKVGVFGTSYPGFYAGMAAASGHPALKAVSPQAPVTDWFEGDDFQSQRSFFFTWTLLIFMLPVDSADLIRRRSV
ncbi:MAG: CocE/NonD family hydrolase [Puia sp.]